MSEHNQSTVQTHGSRALKKKIPIAIQNFATIFFLFIFPQHNFSSYSIFKRSMYTYIDTQAKPQNLHYWLFVYQNKIQISMQHLHTVTHAALLIAIFWSLSIHSIHWQSTENSKGLLCTMYCWCKVSFLKIVTQELNKLKCTKINP